MVEQRLGKPVDKIAKGRNRFVVKNDEYDVFIKITFIQLHFTINIIKIT